jgi:hypothetical protein
MSANGEIATELPALTKVSVRILERSKKGPQLSGAEPRPVRSILPGRKPLVTLRDAALYITKLPKAEHVAEEWQAALQALLLVVQNRTGQRCSPGSA